MFYLLCLVFTYFYSPAESTTDTPTNCKDGNHPFLRLTKNRFLSYEKMSRDRAQECCLSKNMILHTPESADDEEKSALAKALFEAESILGDGSFWSSGHFTDDEDVNIPLIWHFGTSVMEIWDRSSSNNALEIHVWVGPHVDTENFDATDCLAIRSWTDDGLFVGIEAKKCTEEKHFVCQYNQFPRAGKDLTFKDREYCENQKESDFHNLLGPLFVHTKKKVNWRTAKYCCEKQGMTLAGNLFYKEKKNMEILSALQKLEDETHFYNSRKNDGGLDEAGFWVGLTAFCNETWVWPCGELDDVRNGWSMYFKPTQSKVLKRDYEFLAPDNYLRNEYCGEVHYNSDNERGSFVEADYEYVDDPELEPLHWRLYKNDLDCNKQRYFMCQKDTKCPKGKPFTCYNPPTSVISDTFVENDLITCKNLTFEILGGNEDYAYYILKRETTPALDGREYDNLLTWEGATKCLEDVLELSKESVTFADEEDKDFFQTFLQTNESAQDRLIWVHVVANGTGSKIKPTEQMNYRTSKVSVVPSHDIISYDNISNISPLCGAIGYYKGKAGLVFINCLERHYIAYRKKIDKEIPDDNTTIILPPIIDIGNNNTIVDPLVNRTNNGSLPCVDRTIATLLPSFCPNISTSINSPSAKQLELNKNRATNEELHKLRYQNRKLKQTVVDIALTGITYYAHNPRNTHRLAALVAGVYIAQCPEVPRFFIEDILHYLHRLHFFTSRDRYEFLNEDEFVWMRKMMQTCINESRLLTFRTDECGELIYSEGSCENYICPDPEYQFNTTKFDPMMEAWWKMYELAHAVCFEFFTESYRMFHLYAQAFMDTWSEALRLRMGHQIQLNKFWERILGPEYELYLLNMDRCNEAVIRQASLPYRQHISTLPKRVRLHGEKLGKSAANDAQQLL